MTTLRRLPSPTALSVLRSLAPNRVLTPVEASFVIEQQATRLLELASIVAPPVSLTTVIAVLPRITVRYTRRLETSGRSQWTGITWLILIDGREPEERQRFTLAHEIGHIVYHPLHSSLASSDGVRARMSRLEVAVSYFAACLLMPGSWVNRALAEGQAQNLDSLAQLFGVSRQMAARRLIELGLIDPLEVKRLGGAA